MAAITTPRCCQDPTPSAEAVEAAVAAAAATANQEVKGSSLRGSLGDIEKPGERS